ncbi:MAG TPA: MBOAT family O-acyltransferase [Bacteroidia bacterium]|nr:MBOAT family O-acyltransferase [Bacteroidia bacterium]
MLFNSLEFLFFFPIVTALYFALPHKYRWFLLLAASCYFYMAFVPIYILILGFTIVIDYFAGIMIENAQGRRRKAYLVISILSNVGVLALFKYYNFINANLSELLGWFHHENPIPFLKILLPVGLSFHTFQAMSYTIEVYRGHQKAERHFGIYSLYVMFYPQLVAGPIERPQNLLHQFREKHTFEYSRVVAGLRLMLWGMFKKVVIADRLAVYVDEVFNHPDRYHGLPVILASVFFAVQIYCDFSGYSDIAIGSARVMGFNLMQNFNLPYFSTSVREFWTRWHISLSTWFRDYVYFPLGGNRVKVYRWYFNLMAVFLISGLWHGAKWTFVIWGALHGIYLVIEAILARKGMGVTEKTGKAGRAIGWMITMLLVVLGWIFFRANTATDALTLLSNFFRFDRAGLGINVYLGYGSGLADKVEIILCFLVIAFLFLVNYFERKRPIETIVGEMRTGGRWLTYYCTTMAILLFGNFSGKAEFIYFQF